jgi:superoxide dismutase, Fe-Mn family
MKEEAYRASVLEWCQGLEASWLTLREQLTHTIEESQLRIWEEHFLHLKREIENNELNETELYEKANALYADLNRFIDNSAITTVNDERVQSVPIGGHKLPPLPYAYNALEPVIAEEIMRLHHSKHHQSYVDGLNKAEKEMKKAREQSDFSLIKHWEREAAFHGSGHYLHTIFWNIMHPDGGGEPRGQLSRAINQTFGSFAAFKKHFSEAAKNVEAVGWAILVWAPRAQRLEILTAEKHQNLTQWDVIPLLVLDVWEHAYYLQYKNERAKYVENWWGVVNWRAVEQRFNKARTIAWEPY